MVSIPSVSSRYNFTSLVRAPFESWVSRTRTAGRVGPSGPSNFDLRPHIPADGRRSPT